MLFHIRRAFTDILENRFLNAVTIVTISLSVLIVSGFGLFFLNARDMFDTWKKGVRIMVYLEPGTSENQQSDTRLRLQTIAGVQKIRFVSKQDAMMRMKERMKGQLSLLDNLRENPLPDAFEVALSTESQSMEKMAFLAQRIKGLASVSDVEYGRPWIERFSHFFNLFKLVGYGMGGMFFIATVFITANTIRLMLYSRKEEIQIMRLVGATDNFIRIPFFFEGMIQGLCGALIGLGVLYATVITLGLQFEQTLAAEMVTIGFFSPCACAGILGTGILTGLLGCFLSLKQFLKQ